MLTVIFESCVVVCLVLLVVDLAVRRQVARVAIEAAVLGLLAAAGLMLVAQMRGRVSFGDDGAPLSVVVAIFVATALGIGARYLFYLRPSQFSWLNFLKPFAITPIVVLPLMGSLQGLDNLKEIQIVSFAFLAFQNGFFWQAALESARPQKG